MSLLVGRGIGVAVKGRRILERVDFALARGEVVGLLGPNGAGKTTLLRALAGLVPASGEVCLDGRPLAAMTAGERARRVAYQPQGANAHWPLPVAEVVALGRLPHLGPFRGPAAADRATIARAMAEADVTGLAPRPFTALSAGERARVLLARALAVAAPVLLLDEPVALLDPGHQLQVLALLGRRARAGDGVVVVLHDLALAMRFCGRLVVLDRGQVVREGPPADVLDDDLLGRVYGVRATRGVRDGMPYVLPWTPTNDAGGGRA